MNIKQFTYPLIVLYLTTVLNAGQKGYEDDKIKRLPNTSFLKEENTRRISIRTVCRSFIGNNSKVIKFQERVYPNDCSGMVRAVFSSVGIDVMERAHEFGQNLNGVQIIYKSYKEKAWSDFKRKPRPGDLIIFNNTYDKNKNGLWDDLFTHISVVTGVETNGTVAYIHHVSRGIQRYRLNLDKNGIYKEGENKYNDFLRVRPSSDKNKKKYLADNLFFCFIDILGSRPAQKEETTHSKKKVDIDKDIKKLIKKHKISRKELIKYLQEKED